MNKKLIIVSIITLAIMGTAIYLYPRITKPNMSDTSFVVSTSTPVYVIAPIPAASTTPSTVGDTHPGMKLYQNKEFGFEFWYPEGWWVEENHDINPFIKLEVNVYSSPQGIYDTFHPFVVLISTPEHAQQVLTTIKNEGTPVQAIIGGMNITGYDFFGPANYTNYIIIFSDHGVFLSNENKEHVPEFNQILSTFKFTK